MLPEINPIRLQRVVADAEFDQDLDFNALCEAVAECSWAKRFDLSALVVGALIIKHDIATKAEKPASVDVPEDKPEDKVEDKPEIKTYTEGGKGRKQCTACSAFVGVRTPVCACGHAFKNGESKAADVAPEPVKTYDEGGKGKKQCSACKKYVGLRTAVCACGHPFEKKDKPQPQPQQEPAAETVVMPAAEVAEVPRGRRFAGGVRMRIAVAAGACPHRLSGTDKETVEAWAENLRRTYMDRDGSWLNASAMKYFARDFYPIFDKEGRNPEYIQVCAFIDELYGND